MHTRIMGKTGLEVTEIGFGTYAVGGAARRGGTNIPTGYSGANIFESLQTLRKAWDLGINFFDTADVYGRGKSEVLLGMALHYVKDRAIIASKGGNVLTAAAKDFSADYLRGALDASLARLEMDALDNYMLHSPPLDKMTDEAFAAMTALKAEGRIKSWGVSVNGVAEARRAIDGGAEVIEVIFNLVESEMAEAVFPLARKHNVGIIVREALCSGFLTGKFARGHVFPADDLRSARFPAQRVDNILQTLEKLDFLREEYGSMAEAALRYTLSFPEVSTVIVGCKSIAQLDANVKVDGKRISDAHMQRIREVVASCPDCSADSKSFGFRADKL